jgi:predicted transcriptional regulator
MKLDNLILKALLACFIRWRKGFCTQKFLTRNSTNILKIVNTYSDHSLKYRSRTEIVAMILEAANGGATKTKIMYKAFLSYAQLREYLSVLIENNLLQYVEGSQTYKTTEKGLNFLKMNNEIGELLQTPSIKER